MYMPRFNADVQEPEPKEEAPMNTTSTIAPISENPKQPQQRQTAKDIIAANVKSLAAPDWPWAPYDPRPPALETTAASRCVDIPPKAP
jgi:hypothetical protein